MQIRSSVFRGNRALDTYSAGGGAVIGHVSIDGCTFVNNTALQATAGTIAALSNGTVTNSIIVGGGANPVEAGSVTYTLVEGGMPGMGNQDADPWFWDRPQDLRLLPGSPAIDAGDPAASLDPDGTRRDLGAFPFDPAVGDSIGATICAGNPNSTGAGAELAVRGSTHVADDRITLHVEGVPAGSLGYSSWPRRPRRASHSVEAVKARCASAGAFCDSAPAS